MRAIRAIARAAGIALLALTLGGCAVYSRVPLIPQSELPEGVAGSYQPMGAMDVRTMRKIPRAQRSGCLDPGYTGLRFENLQRTGKPIRHYYCGYDPDRKKPAPLVEVTRGNNDFVFSDSEGRPLRLRLKSLRAELYLGQLDVGDAEPRFDYPMLRTRSGNVEIIFLLCEDFPSVPASPIPFTTPVGGPPGPSQCELTSLDSIRTDLDRLAGKVEAGNIPPSLILRRIAK